MSPLRSGRGAIPRRPCTSPRSRASARPARAGNPARASAGDRAASGQKPDRQPLREPRRPHHDDRGHERQETARPRQDRRRSEDDEERREVPGVQRWPVYLAIGVDEEAHEPRVEEIVGDQQAPERVGRLIPPEQVAGANDPLEDQTAHDEGETQYHREPPDAPRMVRLLSCGAVVPEVAHRRPRYTASHSSTTDRRQRVRCRGRPWAARGAPTARLLEGARAQRGVGTERVCRPPGGTGAPRRDPTGSC